MKPGFSKQSEQLMNRGVYVLRKNLDDAWHEMQGIQGALGEIILKRSPKNKFIV